MMSITVLKDADVKERSKPKFYTFVQNNSGGSFHIDEEIGIAETVIIEANSADDANSRAERIGIYFNGVTDGLDCECCGDRWYKQYSDDRGYDVPSYCGTPIEKVDFNFVTYLRRFIIHMMDGSITKVQF